MRISMKRHCIHVVILSFICSEAAMRLVELARRVDRHRIATLSLKEDLVTTSSD